MLPLAVVDVTEVLAAAVVDSSFLAHDPRSATVPTIKTIQNSNFFIITSFIVEKCRIIPTFMYRVVLTNTGITPGSHNLKQLKNAPRKFSQGVYTC